MDYLKIDEVAKQTGLTKRAIRYYEEIGLLETPQRTDGGTRLYTEEDIIFLQRLILARDVLGFSLNELQHYLKESQALELDRTDYPSITDPLQQRDKLAKMVNSIDKQVEMLIEKTNKIEKVRKELEHLRERATTKIQQIDGDQ
ncbi:MerR family transcriptional regulator [Bacillus sp. 1P06AnD]|uniref:MerR family transcriptional regulator n=1 Tax=Bacillus sp. 1P06AnD TaxID=3132208 RepID=UPI0039A3EE1D